MTTWDLRFRALPGIPLIQPGDDLAALIARAAEADGLALADGDVVVVAQKVVSKAEGRIVRLAGVTPTPTFGSDMMVVSVQHFADPCIGLAHMMGDGQVAACSHGLQMTAGPARASRLLATSCAEKPFRGFSANWTA